MTSENRQTVNTGLNRLARELDSAVQGILVAAGAPLYAEVSGRELAHLAVRIVLEEWGGLDVHVPSLRTFEIEARNMAIVEGHGDGYSYAQLAERHGITTREVRRIIHGHRRKKGRRPVALTEPKGGDAP